MHSYSSDFQNVMNRAAAEAQQHGHTSIELEHIMTALCGDQNVRQQMKDAKIDADSLPPAMDDYFSKHPNYKDRQPLHTPPNSLSRPLQNTLAEAFKISDNVVGITPLNMLLALGQSQSYAGSLLRGMGITQRIGAKHLFNPTPSISDPDAVDSDPQRDNEPLLKKPGMSLMVVEPQNTETPARKSDTDEEEYSFTIRDLPDFCTNMTQMAREGAYRPAIGRDGEMKQLSETLSRHKKKSALLHGASGVGKTAIVEGLAWNIANGNVPEKLKNANIYSLNTAALAAGTRYHGMFEEKLSRFITEVEKDPKAILFVDDMETLIGLGASSTNSVDASTMLRPALASGKIRFIGAAADDDLPIIEKDKSLLRRVRKIAIDEPGITDAIAIVSGSLAQYENEHAVRFAPKAIEAAAKLSARYLGESKMPDSVFEVLDDAGVLRRSLTAPGATGLVTRRDVEKIISERTGKKIGALGKSESEKLISIDTALKSVILDQDDAIDVLSDALRRARSPFRNPGQPLGSFLLSGPTGVGKTETVRQLAELQDMDFVRIDMSEFMEKHSVSRLIGAPPGYVGYEDEGLLTGPVRKKPHTIVLLDEIEKAHPDIFNILLQVMDHGRLTDGQGRKIDFTNTIVMMSTNAGVAAAKNGIGFTAEKDSKEQSITEGLSAVFTPEFRNRLSAVIPYHYLEEKSMEGVARKFITPLVSRAADEKLTLECRQSAIDWLVKNGTNRDMGARPMQHLIRDEIETELAKAWIDGSLKKGGKVTICFNEAVEGNVKTGKKGLSFVFENPAPRKRQEQSDPVIILSGPKAA